MEVFGNNLNKNINERSTFDKIGNLHYKYDDENLIKPKSVI
jgi:hypothetical protein